MTADVSLNDGRPQYANMVYDYIKLPSGMQANLFHQFMPEFNFWVGHAQDQLMTFFLYLRDNGLRNDFSRSLSEHTGKVYMYFIDEDPV